MNIKINVTELKTILTKNRGIHETDYEEAKSKYLILAREEVLVMLEKISADKFPKVSIKASQPLKFLDEYDRTLRMLELHQEDTIVISDKQYANYVDDNWQWSHSFSASTLSYKSA